MTRRVFSGSVVLITGGTDGIGLAAAHSCGAAGAKVMVASRKQENVDKALAQLKAAGVDCHGIAAHAAKKDDIARMVEETLRRFGRLDHLFVNHAVSPG
jgi:dehydrogenase/reductase SDR family protein 4